MAAYRRPTSWMGCLWVVIVMLGLAGQVAVMALLSEWADRLQAWIFLPAMVPFLGSIGLAAWLQHREMRRRVQGICRSLTALGFDAVPEPSASLKETVRDQVAAVQGPFVLRGGSDNVVWLALRDQTFVFEHRYTTGSGKSTQVHEHTVIAWPGASPEPARVAELASAPWCLVARPRLGEKRALKRALGEDRVVGDPDFDRRWSIHGDEATAQAFLTAQVKGDLGDAPRGEIWSLGGGWVACGCPFALDSANLLRFLVHTTDVLTPESVN